MSLVPAWNLFFFWSTNEQVNSPAKQSQCLCLDDYALTISCLLEWKKQADWRGWIAYLVISKKEEKYNLIIRFSDDLFIVS